MSDTTTPKPKDIPSWKRYINDRQQYLLAIGLFRCLDSEKGKKRCGEICQKCLDYYDMKKKFG